MKDEIYCKHGGRMHEAIGDTFDFPEKRNDCVPADVLDAWYPPHSSVSQFLIENMNWLVGTSPPCRMDALRAEVANYLDIPSSNLLLGSGSSDLIFRIMTSLFPGANSSTHLQTSESRENRKIGIVSPCYGEYAHVASKLCGLEISRIYSDSDQLAFSAREILDEVRCKSLKALCLVNPCNPTGQYLPIDEMTALVMELPESCPLLVDETYIQFVGRKHSVAKMALSRKNLIVIESFSKFFALSGVRVGCAISHSDLASRLEETFPTYQLSNFAIGALSKSLKQVPYYFEKVDETHKLRQELSKMLLEIHFLERVLPSTINSVLIKVKEQHSAEKIRIALGELSIFIRNISEQGLKNEDCDRYLRIAVLDQARNTAVYKGLKYLSGMPNL
ncbi:MAG: aminotransferase class I/II-fold pyridoxal phosphate-dependent enzyme [Pseudomonadota bacterium]